MSTTAPVPGSIIGHYQLVRELGRGGMGTVFEAQDRRDGSRVALKLLHPWLAEQDPGYRVRFEREAHYAALLRSPYCVHLLEYGESGGQYYLAMEFVEGQTVAELLRRSGPLPPERALRIGAEVARALEEAEARSIVHRDVKPDNILVTPEGRAKITDFGIARQEGSQTITGGFVGTPSFASPEQGDGRQVDSRTDIYSLGATLFAMLTGRPPFEARSPLEVMRMHSQAPVPMAQLAHLPDAVTNPVRRCLEKDPLDRYQGATELAGALERAIAVLGRTHGPTVGAAPTPVLPDPRSGATATRVAQGNNALTMALETAVSGNRRAQGYTLQLRNDSSVPVTVRLDAGEPTGTLRVTTPREVTVPAYGTAQALVEARQVKAAPGDRVQFQVSAQSPGGERLGFAQAVVPTSTPRKFRALAIGAGAAVALLAVVGGGAYAAGLFEGDGNNDGGGTPEGTEQPDGPFLKSGGIDFSLEVMENTCGTGSPVKAAIEAHFKLEAKDGSAFIADKEEVIASKQNSSGEFQRIPGSFRFEETTLPNGKPGGKLVVHYAINSPFEGKDVLTILVDETGVVRAAELTETPTKGGPCRIHTVAKQQG